MRNYEKRKRLKPKTKNGYVYKEYLYKQKINTSEAIIFVTSS